MKKIITKYNEECNKLSDINEHLPTLFEYASQCDIITEMGTRFGVSTIAMLATNPVKMTSYDIMECSNEINNLIKLTQEYNINYSYIQADTLSIDIEPTDLLFIDTLHTYNQLLMELTMHSKNVNKFIIMHDTIIFGYNNEGIYINASNIIKNKPIVNEGLYPAINDFLKSNYGKTWHIHKHFTNNNGLTILKND